MRMLLLGCRPHPPSRTRQSGRCETGWRRRERTAGRLRAGVSHLLRSAGQHPWLSCSVVATADPEKDNRTVKQMAKTLDMPLKTTKCEVQDYLKTPDQQAAYLEAALESDDRFVHCCSCRRSSQRSGAKFSRETGLKPRSDLQDVSRGRQSNTQHTERRRTFFDKLTLVPKKRIAGSSAIGHLSGRRAAAAKAKKRA